MSTLNISIGFLIRFAVLDWNFSHINARLLANKFDISDMSFLVMGWHLILRKFALFANFHGPLSSRNCVVSWVWHHIIVVLFRNLRRLLSPCIYSRKKTRCFDGPQIVRRHSRSCLDLWHQHRSWAIQTSNDSSRSKRTLVTLAKQGHTVIEYASHALNKAEQNYSATEKECLGVVWALQKFAMHLEGSSFKVITDHKPLTYLLSPKEPRGKLAT